ncbi:MAG: YtxH domain-containing protein [Acidobacteriaceae bacterium]|nr:YtxH domain-containing protein [Acidobacteriaceae bacterium]
MADEKECGVCGAGVRGLGWFLAGLGLGAVVGVLYAPKAGKETREDLLNCACEAKDKATDLIEEAKDKANDLIEEGKKKAAELVEKGQEFYEKGHSQWTQYVEKGKGLISEQQAKVGAAVEAGKEAYVKTTAE